MSVESHKETLLSRQQQRRSKRNALKNQNITVSRNMTFTDIMDDLTIRFIMNCPEEEFESFDRLFFQIEEAHWFYEDFYREHNKSLPALSFKQFVDKVFEHCPALSPYREAVDKHTQSFYDYKHTVPVYGAIILNQTRDKVLLVKGWTSKTWSFPRGKINQDEPELICAAREVKEEIGFDITPYLNAKQFIMKQFNEQTVKLFIVYGIPESTHFAPESRKEISAIEWHSIESITNARSPGNPKKSASKYWTISAFMPELKKRLQKIEMNSQSNKENNKRKSSPKSAIHDAPSSEGDKKRGNRRGRKSPTTEQPNNNHNNKRSNAPRKLTFANNSDNQKNDTFQHTNPPVIMKRESQINSTGLGFALPIQPTPQPTLSSSPPMHQYFSGMYSYPQHNSFPMYATPAYVQPNYSFQFPYAPQVMTHPTNQVIV